MITNAPKASSEYRFDDVLIDINEIIKNLRN